jgi:hypothetical protein
MRVRAMREFRELDLQVRTSTARAPESVSWKEGVGKLEGGLYLKKPARRVTVPSLYGSQKKASVNCKDLKSGTDPHFQGFGSIDVL